MAFLSKLFGGAGREPTESKVVAEESYKGFSIAAKPIPEGSQYRLAATITKPSEAGVRSHAFVRADLFSTADDAAAFAIQKAKRLIDEQGERLLD